MRLVRPWLQLALRNKINQMDEGLKKGAAFCRVFFCVRSAAGLRDIVLEKRQCLK